MSDTKSSMRTSYPTDEDYHHICRVDTAGKSVINVFVRPISERQSVKLDNGESIVVKHNGVNLELKSDYCYATGKIDVEDPDDIAIINSFKWVNSKVRGFFIPRNYDYEHNEGDQIMGVNGPINATVETFSNLNLFKFAYACIGKPKYVAIYGITGIRRTAMAEIDGW